MWETPNRLFDPNINNQYYDYFNSHSVGLFVSLSANAPNEYASMRMSVSMHVSAGYLYSSHVLNRSTIMARESSIGSRAYGARLYDLIRLDAS